MEHEFESVIGLEVHCQLATRSKIFCSCPSQTPEGMTVADLKPNSRVCPVCSGQPGALPVLNAKAVEYAVQAGLALHCAINPYSILARKNYFYPDLPRGYQISQYELPICGPGWLEIQTEKHGQRRITIQRIHLEEDAGKSQHLSGFSVVNLNRAGVPLIEIVSGPEMRTAEEAGSYLRTLHAIVTYLGITDGNMQEGNFRCDANVSVRPRGQKTLGTRTEIKNVNSFRFVEKAIDYEILRQIEVIRSGGRVVQETRTFDSGRGVTISMRSKEEAEDYRYFPDPDLVPILVEQKWMTALKDALPELPVDKKNRYVSDLGLTPYDAEVVTASRPLAEFFEKALSHLRTLQNGTQQGAAKILANWIAGEFSRLLNESGLEVERAKITPQQLAQTVALVLDQTISGAGAKEILTGLWSSGGDVLALVESRGLKQVNDQSFLIEAIDKVVAGFPLQVAEYRSGKEKLLGFFVGQVMKESQGKANPGLVGELIKKKLASS